MEKYAVFYFSLFPFSYLFEVPDGTAGKIALFLVLSLPFMLKAIGMLRRGEAWSERLLVVILMAFLASVFLSGGVSLFLFPDIPLRRMAGTIAMVIWPLAFFGMATACSRRCLQWALQALTMTTLLAVSVVFLLDRTIDFIPGAPPPQLSLGLNTISLGKLLLAAVPGAMLMARPVFRYVLLLLLAILIFMTGARTIAIALLATLGIFTFLQAKHARTVPLFLTLATGAVAGIMLAIWRGLPVQRLIGLHTLQLRFEAWLNTLAVWWRMNPVTGVGPGMHRHYLHGPHRLDDLPCAYEAGHAHSDYLAALADLGVIGFLTWATLLALMFVQLWRRWHEDLLARVSLAIFIGYLVAALTEVHFLRLREMTLVVVVMVLGFATMIHHKRASPSRSFRPRLPTEVTRS